MVKRRVEPLTADEEHVIAYWMRACRRVRKAIRNMAGRDLWLVVSLEFARLLEDALRRYSLFLDTDGLCYDNPYAVMWPENYYSSPPFTLDGMQVYIGDGIGMRTFLPESRTIERAMRCGYVQ